MTKPSSMGKNHLAKQISSSFTLFTIIFFTLSQVCICNSADISDIRRLRIRAALSDPVEESCKGSLDYNGFSKLDKICKDCFNLIREPEIYQLCRTDCFCNEFFSFCARDIEGLTDNEIPTLPNSCFISSKEDTTTVTSKPEETTKLASENADTKNSDDKSVPNSSLNDKKLNKKD